MWTRRSTGHWGTRNIQGRVLQAMDFDSVKDYVSVDYYLPPESEDEEFTLRFPEYTKFVSQMFDTKEEAMEEKRVTDIVCTKCRRMLRKKIRWFSSGQRYYLCLATCPEHGMMKGKIRMKKSEDGRVFAVKTVKPVDEEGAEAVFLKKEGGPDPPCGEKQAEETPWSGIEAAARKIRQQLSTLLLNKTDVKR